MFYNYARRTHIRYDDLLICTLAKIIEHVLLSLEITNSSGKIHNRFFVPVVWKTERFRLCTRLTKKGIVHKLIIFYWCFPFHISFLWAAGKRRRLKASQICHRRDMYAYKECSWRELCSLRAYLEREGLKHHSRAERIKHTWCFPISRWSRRPTDNNDSTENKLAPFGSLRHRLRFRNLGH